MNLRGVSHRAGICFFFDTQMNARSLRQRERLKWAECALAEDGIDVTYHERILIL